MGNLYRKIKCPACKGEPIFCHTCKNQGTIIIPISDMGALLKILGDKTTKRVNDPSDTFYKKGRLDVVNMVVVKSSDPTLGDERPDCVFFFDTYQNFVAVGVFE